MTNFTSKDLKENSDSIMAFFRARPYLKIGDVLIGGKLHSKYNTRKCIKALELHIEKHKYNMRLQKHFPLWDKNLEILKGLI